MECDNIIKVKDPGARWYKFLEKLPPKNGQYLILLPDITTLLDDRYDKVIIK